MIVANIEITVGGRFASAIHRHAVGFDDLEKAKEEYGRLKELLLKRGERGNDLPRIIEVDGASGAKLTVPLDEITSIGLMDLALAEEHEKGVTDAFPRIMRRAVR